MTADSLDLEDTDNLYRGVIHSLYEEDMTFSSEFKNFEHPKSQTSECSYNSFSIHDDINQFDSFNSYLTDTFEDPFADAIADCRKSYSSSEELLSNNSVFPDCRKSSSCSDELSNTSVFPDCRKSSSSSDELFDNNSGFPSLMDCCTTLVPLDAILPIPVNLDDEISPLPVKEEDSGDEAVDSIWPEVSNMTDMKLDFFEDEVAPFDDLLRKKKRMMFTHEFDHSYSIRPFRESNDYDFFNYPPYSPASSSCSDKSRGVKRTLSKKAVKHIKIKQEIITSDEEEVDVETPYPIQLAVPKLKHSRRPPVKTGPAKRGRKPKNKSEGQNVKKSNKNCPVSAKALQAAIKQQQKQRCYITKSGRVSNKVSNSVETTPSTSTPSSVSNSRCTSDNEDNVDKRASHNMAERNRRQELTKLFQNVRMKVPEIERDLKASKVKILTSAARHIGSLERIDKTKASQKQQLEAEIKKKLAMVQSLRISRGYSS